MSADNIAIKDRFLGLVMAGDFDALRALLHPEFTMRQASMLPYAGLYEGPDGFLSFLGVFMGTYDFEALENGETFAAESGALVGELILRGTLKATGGRVDTTLLEKWEFRDGKVWRISPHYFDPTPR